MDSAVTKEGNSLESAAPLFLVKTEKNETSGKRRTIELVFQGKEEGRLKCLVCGIPASTGAYCHGHWVGFIRKRYSSYASDPV